MVALRGHAPLATLLVLAGFALWKTEWLGGAFTPGTLNARLAAVRLVYFMCEIRLQSFVFFFLFFFSFFFCTLG